MRKREKLTIRRNGFEELAEGITEDIGETFDSTENDKVFEREAAIRNGRASVKSRNEKERRNSRIDVTIQLECEATIGSSLVLNGLHSEDRLLIDVGSRWSGGSGSRGS